MQPGHEVAVASLDTHRLILAVPQDGPVELRSTLAPADAARVLRHIADQLVTPHQPR